LRWGTTSNSRFEREALLGAGRGLTTDVAIQGAIWDAEASAGAELLFTCTLVGEPTVFESTDNPIFGHVFRAMVELSCTP
jgi:hypothetical protein